MVAGFVSDRIRIPNVVLCSASPGPPHERAEAFAFARFLPSPVDRSLLHHEVTDKLFTFLAHIRRSLSLASRPRGLPAALLGARDGTPLTEEEFWAEHPLASPP